MKNKSQELIVPSPQVGSVIPKPSKADIIKAMVERARVRHFKIAEGLLPILDQLNKAAEEAALEELKEQFSSGTNPEPDITIYSNRYVRVSFQMNGPKTMAAIQALHKAQSKHPGVWCEQDVTKEIKEAMSAAKVILQNDENVKRIDTLLEEMTGR